MQTAFQPQRRRKIIVYNPYAPFGGGGQIQAWFMKVLKQAVKEGDFETLNISSRRSGVWGYIASIRKAKRCRAKIASTDILILQGHFNPGTILLGRYSALHKVPYILVARGDFVPTYDSHKIVRRPLEKWLIWRFFGKRLLNGATEVVVTSEMEGVRLYRAGARKDRMVVIPDPFYAHVKEESSDVRIGSDDRCRANRPFSLCLGRIAREKGLELLIECWPTVLKTCPTALLIIAGSVSHTEVYRQLIKLRRRLRLDKSVLFMDWVTGQDKSWLLEQARCLALPSQFESFGGVVLEALAKQTPVVVSTGTPWQHIDGTCGKWIPRRVSEWADAMCKYLDPEEKIKVPLSVLQGVLAQYREDAVVEKWAALLKKSLVSKKINHESFVNK